MRFSSVLATSILRFARTSLLSLAGLWLLWNPQTLRHVDHSMAKTAIKITRLLHSLPPTS